MSLSSIPLQDLLVHADFLRQLARDLVGPVEADELAQDVWVQALRRPPASRESLRGWLATTARNLRANRARGEARRGQRERDVARSEALPSTQDVLAREQVREGVVRAVLALDEPFREAVLLRYYVGLEPREIARRLDVPPATVRSRLSRGLERLRARLDGEHGERAQWSLALAPWLHWPGRGTSVIGELFFMKKAVLVLAALVLCGLLVRVALVPPIPGKLAGEQDRGIQVAQGTSKDAEDSEQQLPEPTARVPVQAPLAPVASDASRTFPAERGRGALFGDVVDEADRPVAGVPVHALPHMGHLPHGLVIDDDRQVEAHGVTDDQGRFRFEGLEAGPFHIEARQQDDQRDVLVGVVSAQGEAGPFRLRLGRTPVYGNDLRILVVDAQAEPLAEAQVEIFAWSPRLREHEQVERGRVEPLFRGTTDTEGRIAAQGLEVFSGIVTARTVDGRAGQASLWSLSTGSVRTDVRVVVRPPGAVRVELTGLSAEALEGATLSLHSLAQLQPYYTSGGRKIDAPIANGEATFNELAAGTYGVSLDAPSGARLVVAPMRWGEDPMPNSVEMPTVEVAPDATSELTLALAAGCRIQGSVSADGRGVKNALVRAVIAPRTSNFPAGFVLHGVHVWRLDSTSENGPANPLSHVHATTDANGRYELRGLQPGTYRVEVTANRLSFDRRMEVELAEGATVELRHELQAAGVLQVAALGVTYLGVLAPDQTVPAMLAITRDDLATFPGLPAGRWIVARFHSDVSVAPQSLGEAIVVAGRTTWLDLRAASVRSRIHGVVQASGTAVEGAEVRLYPATARTDARGAFLLELGHEIRFRAIFSSGIVVRHGGTEFTFVPDIEQPVRDLEIALELGKHECELEVAEKDQESPSGRADFHWTAQAGAESGPRTARGSVPLRAGRARLGPLSAGTLQGTLQLDDGSQWPFECTVPRTEPLRIELPARGRLQVRVLRQGKPHPGTRVDACTWIGEGAAPQDVESFFDAAESQIARTGEDGIATLQVRAGEVLIHARGEFEARREAHTARARVEAGSVTEVTIAID